jgi:hypothetical protein
MRIYGDIQLDPGGAQIINHRLENLGGSPTPTASGRIFFNTSTKKVMVWNGTAWSQISSAPDYFAGDGMSLGPDKKFNINLYNSTTNTSGLQFDGGYLKLKADTSQFDLDGDGLSLKAGGITEDLLAGNIPDSMLQQITTADKVAASAVEDVFLRKDIDDTTIGTLTVKDLILDPETTPGTTSKGKIYYNTGDDRIYYWDGSSWQVIYTSNANVSSVTGTLPITASPTTGAVGITISQADSVTDGYLTQTDWNEFNNKQDSLTWGQGLTESAGTVNVVLSATNPGLEFDGFDDLKVLLKPSGGILVDATGLYLDNIIAGFQVVWNLDARRPNVWFNLDSGGSWTIRNFANNVSILQVDDGTVGTSVVTVSNLIIQGDLDSLGDNSRIRTTELWVKDRSLSVGYLNPAVGTPLVDSSFDVLRGSDPTVRLRWNETLDIWDFTNDGVTYMPIGIGALKKLVQGFAGVDTLTVSHNFDDNYPQVQIYDNTGKQIKPLEIINVDSNTVQVTFDAIQTGNVVVIGGASIGTSGGGIGSYSQIFNVTSLPWKLSIPYSVHGLGPIEDLIVQVMDNSVPRQIIYPTITVSNVGTVELTFLGAQQGKVLIIK